MVELVYPRGSTLNVQEPAVPIITSGFISYPLNRPIGAVSVSKVCVSVVHEQSGLVVVGGRRRGVWAAWRCSDVTLPA